MMNDVEAGYLEVPKDCQFTFIRLKEANKTLNDAYILASKMYANLYAYVMYRDSVNTNKWDENLDKRYKEEYEFSNAVNTVRVSKGELPRDAFYDYPYQGDAYVEAYRTIISVLVADKIIDLTQNDWDLTNLIKGYRDFEEYRSYTY